MFCSRTKGEVEKTRVDLKESQEKCAEKDKLISDLKQALDRLTTNNNDMVELLEGKVSWSFPKAYGSHFSFF